MKMLFLSLVAMAAFSAPIAFAQTGPSPINSMRRVEPLPPSPEMLGETNVQSQRAAAVPAQRSHVKIFCDCLRGGGYAELENSMNRWFSEHPKIWITERQRLSIEDGWIAIIIYYEETAG